MSNIDIEKLSPGLQVLIGLELENKGMKLELQQLKQEVNQLKGNVTGVNDFSEYPAMLNVEDVAQILRIGRAQAYNLTHREDFPKVLCGKRILIVKSHLLKWIASNTFGMNE